MSPTSNRTVAFDLELDDSDEERTASQKAYLSGILDKFKDGDVVFPFSATSSLPSQGKYFVLIESRGSCFVREFERHETDSRGRVKAQRPSCNMDLSKYDGKVEAIRRDDMNSYTVRIGSYGKNVTVDILWSALMTLEMAKDVMLR